MSDRVTEVHVPFLPKAFAFESLPPPLCGGSCILTPRERLQALAGWGAGGGGGGRGE